MRVRIAARKPEPGFLAGLAAPARRALEGAGLTTLVKLAKKSAELTQTNQNWLVYILLTFELHFPAHRAGKP